MYYDKASALRAYYAALDAAPSALWRMLAAKGWTPWPVNMATPSDLTCAALVPVDHNALPDRWVELLGRYGAVLLATYEQGRMRELQAYTPLVRQALVAQQITLDAPDDDVARVLTAVYSSARANYPTSAPLAIWWLEGRADWRVLSEISRTKRTNNWTESEFANWARSL